MRVLGYLDTLIPPPSGRCQAWSRHQRSWSSIPPRHQLICFLMNLLLVIRFLVSRAFIQTIDGLLRILWIHEKRLRDRWIAQELFVDP